MARAVGSINGRRLPRGPQRRLCGQAGQRNSIEAIIKGWATGIPVQLGGGIRDLDTIERYLDDGLSYVIIGTAAVKSPGP